MKHLIWTMLAVLMSPILVGGCAPDRLQTGGAEREPTIPASTNSGDQRTARAEPTLISPLAVPTDAVDRIGEWGGTLRCAISAEPAVIDPQAAPDLGLRAILPYLFDTLVVRDQEGRLIPSLAQSWEIAQDGKTITMRLKAGVFFQDGNPLDARSVEFTLQRLKKSGTSSPIYKKAQDISAIQVLDPLTVRFSLNGTAEEFWSILATPYASIISPESAEIMAKTGTNQLIGSGPYMLGDWMPGRSITLIRYGGYHWGPAITKNHDAAFIQTLVFNVIPEANAQAKALQTGQIDAIYVNQPDEWLELQQNPAVQLMELPKSGKPDALAQLINVSSKGLAFSKKVEGVKMGDWGQMLLNDAQLEAP